MTADTAFKLCRAYKLFFDGKYNFARYKGGLKMPPLIQQRDRQCYYRIAQKLTDPQIYALFTVAYFFKPKAYVMDLVTPEAFSAGVAFASRAENGATLLEHDLYALTKTLAHTDLDAWLYGERIEGTRAAIPECMQMVINGEMPLDSAALVLLIPQPNLEYNWTQEFAATETTGLGLGPWLTRLKKVDQLIRLQRPGWRILSHQLAKEFWVTMKYPVLFRQGEPSSNTLFA